MTIAAITPPEGREESFSPDRAESADSAGTDEIIPPLIVLPKTGLWRAAPDATVVLVRVEIGDDGDDDDSIIFDDAESMKGLERGNPPGVAIEVEPPITALVLGVGMSPMLDACTLASTGASVVRNVGPSWL